MKEKLRNILAFFVLCLPLATGFAGGNKDTAATTATTHIKFSMWDAVPENNNFIAEFMKENPDISVEVVNIPSDNYSQKLNTMVATHTAPDVMLVWECDLPLFAKGKKLLPLDDYMKNTTAFNQKDLIPAVKKIQLISGGKTYGLPWCYASEILYYNKDMFDAAHVSYPTNDWTWEDFQNAAQKLTITKNGRTVQWGCDDITFKGIWYALIGAAGDPVIDTDGTIKIGDGARRALQFQYDLVNKYKVEPEPSVSSSGSDLFIAGRAAMTRAGSWMCSAYRQIQDFNWDIAPLPMDKRHYSGLHTGFFTISQDTKYKEAAWRFIEFCMSEKGQQMISGAYNNPSAIVPFAEKGAYKVQGEKGPANWDAFDKTAQFGEFGYVVAPAGLTDELVRRFQAAVLGQISVDEALKESQNAIDTIHQ
jgi:multiple sugar transport system substrate-binding protein